MTPADEGDAVEVQALLPDGQQSLGELERIEAEFLRSPVRQPFRRPLDGGRARGRLSRRRTARKARSKRTTVIRTRVFFMGTDLRFEADCRLPAREWQDLRSAGRPDRFPALLFLAPLGGRAAPFLLDRNFTIRAIRPSGTGCPRGT